MLRAGVVLGAGDSAMSATSFETDSLPDGVNIGEACTPLTIQSDIAGSGAGTSMAESAMPGGGATFLCVCPVNAKNAAATITSGTTALAIKIVRRP